MCLVGVGMAGIQGGPAQIVLGTSSIGEVQFTNNGSNTSFSFTGDCGQGGNNCLSGYAYYESTVATYDLWMTGGPPTLGSPTGGTYPIMNGAVGQFSFAGGGFNVDGNVTFNTLGNTAGANPTFEAMMYITSSNLPGYTAGEYAAMDFTLNLGNNPSVDQVYNGGNGANTVGYLSSGQVAPVPEPGSLVLFGSGVLGFAGLMRRKLNF
jgi:hypothetical protein